MHIPSFPLPSNISEVIEFRVPTVEDALLFCDLNEYQEEANTTRYLNHMQDTSKRPMSDSGLWTGEDRRAALWWIFMSTSELGTIPFSYECEHCKKTHYLDLNMGELMESAKALNGLPKQEITLSVKGKSYLANVKPLTGYEAEQLENIRNERDQYEPDSAEWKQQANHMALTELAYCLTFEDQPKDQDDALVWKIDLLKSMYLNTEFRVAFVKVEKCLRNARHGLLTKYDEGRYYLVATIPQCQKVIEQGGEATRTLLLPFRHNDFITTF
ncbi:hypothetical protein R7Q10_17240 [Vibrio sp. Vb0599]|uniref:hypothetical protein n=1 Tax=Vibrio sp. Vb0599 TaxID=3074628 RepID=UPI0029643AED|nr:hypothetical protein [Vibrio sp. Vb0599]MDW1943771.1 hypothetical protein [Vibrio sp. Vb0599]